LIKDRKQGKNTQSANESAMDIFGSLHPSHQFAI
jgi:hypothetical protein